MQEEKEKREGAPGLINQILLALNIPLPEEEFKFHPTRKWRADYGWPEYKLAVEIEGGTWIYGRHNRASGFQKDMEKYNALTMEGYFLLRFTPQDLETGKAYETLAQWFKKRGEGAG